MFNTKVFVELRLTDRDGMRRVPARRVSTPQLNEYARYENRAALTLLFDPFRESSHLQNDTEPPLQFLPLMLPCASPHRAELRLSLMRIRRGRYECRGKIIACAA